DVGERRWGLESPDSFDGAPKREVGCRPDIGTAKSEQQHAVGSEASDAFHLHELGAGGVVVESAEPLGVEAPVPESFGEVTEVGDLRAREADPAQGCVVQGK